MKTHHFVFYISLGILLVMHTVGLVGITGTNSAYFVNLTALNLCITTCCLLLNLQHAEKKKSFLLFFGVALAGYAIEVLGVKTQRVFGEYTYGSSMGLKLANVPLVIGLNWGVLIFSCAAIVSKITVSKWLRVFLGACLMVLLDFVLEPIAMHLDFWNWNNGLIPTQNYIAWWLISAGFLYAIFSLIQQPTNPIAKWIYGIQLVFFCLLHLLLS